MKKIISINQAAKEVVVQKNVVFGTSGHRGERGKDFTEDHVKAITEAVAKFLQDKYPGQKIKVAVGYDTRDKHSPNLETGSYTQIVADQLLAKGIDVEMAETYVPTPVIGWYVQAEKGHTKGCIILTASHNHPKDDGYKFNPENGAPAPTEVTDKIERLANQYFKKIPVQSTKEKGVLTRIVNLEEAFAKNMLETVKKYIKLPDYDFSKNSIVIDATHGTSAKTWRAVEKELPGISLNIVHAEPRIDFGNLVSDPGKSELVDLKKAVVSKKADLGLVNDPDSDRHYVVYNDNGTAKRLTPEEVTLLIFEYFAKKGIPLKGIASTVASSGILRKATEARGVEYFETAVGFKYFAPFLEKAAKEGTVGLGVESSGGMTTSFHTLEKCGYLPGVLLLMMVKDTGKSIAELKKEYLDDVYGTFTFKETSLKYPEAKKDSIIALFKKFPKDQAAFNDFKDQYLAPLGEIKQSNLADGVKTVFQDGSWLLLRLSGTEPIARIYSESENKEQAESLAKQGKVILETVLSKLK
ncbi:MAG: hypothetical protein WC860_00710 [Candidatus Margulisiibacteriota bacterium]|jgi:phosphomannomutase